MTFDPKILTLLVFIIINFLIIFAIKSRTTMVISLIISHLVMVLFFGLLVFNYNSFKEIVLGLILYSMVTLFLISNYDRILFEEGRLQESLYSYKSIFKILSLAIIVVGIFVVSFSVVKNIPKISEFVHEENLVRQEEFIKNPMILPSHPAHIAVKKFYLGKKINDAWSDKGYDSLALSERKRVILKDKLQDTFLLKRSSDMILIVVAIGSCLLLLIRKETE